MTEKQVGITCDLFLSINEYTEDKIIVDWSRYMPVMVCNGKICFPEKFFFKSVKTLVTNLADMSTLFLLSNNYTEACTSSLNNLKVYSQNENSLLFISP